MFENGMNSSVTIKSNITYQIKFMLLSLKNTWQVDRTRFLLKQAKKNTRMRMKNVIYFVNDEK